MQTIIHIGQHKTATTSIQGFLRKNRLELIKRGIYVPDTIAGFDDPSHFVLNVHCLNRDRYSSKKEKLLAEQGEAYIDNLLTNLKSDVGRIYSDALREKCNKVIWSNEGLYLLNSLEEHRKLYDLFHLYSNVQEIVCCFRDVASYKNSYRKQLMKQSILPSDDRDSYRYLGDDSWLFDYPRKKQLLEGVFDKCTYFDYDPDDNVLKFLEVLGVDIAVSEIFRMNVTSKMSKKKKHPFLRLFKN